MAAVQPGRPVTTRRNRKAAAKAGIPAKVGVPNFAVRWQILASVTAGDTIQQLSGTGAVLQLLPATLVTAGLVPLHPLCCFLQYTTVDAAFKDIVFGYEVIS